MAPPPPLPDRQFNIVTSGEGGGHWGALKFYKKIMAAAPLSVIEIAKYWGGGRGAKILQKIMAPPLSVIKIVKYCDVWEGWGGIEGRQNPTKNNGAPFLCH